MEYCWSIQILTLYSWQQMWKHNVWGHYRKGLEGWYGSLLSCGSQTSWETLGQKCSKPFQGFDLQKLVTKTLGKLWIEENFFNQLRASTKSLTLTSYKEWMISSQGQVQGNECYGNHYTKARKRIRRHLDQKERKLSLFTDDMTIYKEKNLWMWQICCSNDWV